MKRARQRGITLIEIMVVLFIIAAAFAAVLVTARASNRASAKASAGKLAAAIRYTYDRAVTTGGYYRLVFDLSANKYWVERSDERFYLVRDKEEAPGRGRAPDEEEEERRRREEEERNKIQYTGIAAQVQPPPQPRRARFQAFSDTTLPKVDLKGCRVRDIYTRRQREPYTEGRAYLYFFPDGHTERAVIHVADPDGVVFTLTVQPLTGRVMVQTGDLAPARGFDDTDDEGQREVAR